MFITIKHRIMAALIVIALAIIFLPILINASRLKIKLWRLPSAPPIPAVQAIHELPAITLLDSSAQKYNPDAWVIQVKTFAEPVYAEQLMHQLRLAGLPAYEETVVNEHLIQHSSVTTVYAGPELTQTAVQRLANALEQHFQIKGTVISFTAM